MLIDCDTCAVRGAACTGCVMTALLSPPRHLDLLDAAEARAIETLARAGFEVTVLEDDEPQRAPIVPRWHQGGRMAV
ncbi:MAG TPA: hypothetical protein VK453_02270 [Micromonosporaceae bacterium]|nr:hypothetical protein [Micromonosporaceae bacterium]